MILLTSLPVVMLLWWRRALPESPRWLERNGRVAEAEAIVAQMEAEYERRHGSLPALQSVVAPPVPQVGSSLWANLVALWSPQLARITAMTWLTWLSITFSYYAFFIWIPSLLVQSGMTLTKSFSYSVAIYLAQIPGYYSASWLNDRIGRQATIASYMVLGGVSAFAMAYAHSGMAIMISGILLSFFMNGTYAGLYAYTPEVFPTDIRTTGTGVASSVGRIGGIVSPILVGWLFPRYGFPGVFGVTTVILLLGASSVFFLGVPTLNRSLEAIATEEVGLRRKKD